VLGIGSESSKGTIRPPRAKKSPLPAPTQVFPESSRSSRSGSAAGEAIGFNLPSFISINPLAVASQIERSACSWIAVMPRVRPLSCLTKTPSSSL
jgi:hypothetical protein